MLFRGPPGHVEPDLGNDLEGCGRIDAVDPSEIDAGEAMQVLAGIKAEGGASGLSPTGRVGQGLARALVREPRELRLDLEVARRDLLLVELEEFHGLPQLEQMLRTPGALQRAGDRLRVRLAVGVAERGEGAGLALPVQDRADDRPAGQ